ncbi:MAG TPA: hypothetical protein VGJ69_10145 [Pyrinomonadaceae bacterium]
MLTKNGLRKLLVAIFVGLSFGASHSAVAQDEDTSKAIKAEVFIKDRKPAARKSTIRYRPAVKMSVNPNATVPPPGMTFAQVGVTFWRFRRSTAADKTKELVEDEDGPVEWTLERIEQGTPLASGQRVRLSIESLSRAGYLYVIDREQYADGSLGEPVLIFPTQKTRDANYVKPGRLIYIPSASGKFRIKPSEGPKPHVGELVTIIVASEPLIDPEQLGPRSIKLPRQQVESWEKQWGVATTRFEMADGAGAIMTEKEQAAGANAATELTQDDPVPQTVYRLAIKPQNPILFSLPMKFRR